MAEDIEIPEPNYNPTPEQIAEAIKGLSPKDDDLIEFETTGMITAEKAIELSKAYIKAEKDRDEEKCIAYYQQLNAQKKANNLEYDPEIEDYIIDFPFYLDGLIDLLNDEEALEFHRQIADNLKEEDYTSLYGYELDTGDFSGLIKLWKRTYKVLENDYIDIIPQAYIIVTDAFYFGYEFYDDYGKLKLTEKEALEAKDFAMTAITEYVFEEVDDRVNPYYDFEQILRFLANSEILDAVILEGFNEATYSHYNLESALENRNLSEKCLLFILDFCCSNDLSNYDCYDNYQFTIDEEMESLEKSMRIKLLKGIIEHPNVTQEILQKLTDSEYEEIAEFASEKLQEFE